MPASPASSDHPVSVFDGTLHGFRVRIDCAPFSAEELQRSYDSLAPSWSWRIQRLGFDAAYLELARQLAAACASRFRDRPLEVLDAGIGSGALSKAVVRALPVKRLHGVDISMAMLGRARKELHDEVPELLLHQTDMAALPLADASVDVVLCGHAIEHLVSPEAGFAELGRVLRPGGLFLLAITRPGALGKWIQLRYKVHCLNPAMTRSMLQRLGFPWLREVALDGGLWPGRMSMALLGTKGINSTDSECCTTRIPKAT